MAVEVCVVLLVWCLPCNLQLMLFSCEGYVALCVYATQRSWKIRSCSKARLLSDTVTLECAPCAAAQGVLQLTCGCWPYCCISMRSSGWACWQPTIKISKDDSDGYDGERGVLQWPAAAWHCAAAACLPGGGCGNKAIRHDSMHAVETNVLIRCW